jgi:hypothetical protein
MIGCRKYFWAAILLLGVAEGRAQQYVLLTTGDTSGVVLYGDPRLEVLARKRPSTPAIRAGNGYRVQIYAGNDRAEATRIKTDFMRRFPGIRTYMTYVQPQFRVKVGDYRSREEAVKMYQQVNKVYAPCMIVPDIVEINPYRDDQ